jgi:hypothetical protein
MYFAGDPLNEKDLLQADLTPEQRRMLQVSFEEKSADGTPVGRFDLILAEGWAVPPEIARRFGLGG